MPIKMLPLRKRLELALAEIENLRQTIRGAQSLAEAAQRRRDAEQVVHNAQIAELRGKLEHSTRLLKAVHDISEPTHNSLGMPINTFRSG